MVDDLPFDYPSSPTPTGAKPKRQGERPDRPTDPVIQKRNRNNRNRGGRFEREVAKRLGGRRVGTLGHPWDVKLPGYARLQTKDEARRPSHARIEQLIRAIPATDELRGLVWGEAAGQGKHGQRLVWFLRAEYVAWHGEGPWAGTLIEMSLDDREFQISDEDYRFAKFGTLEDVVAKLVPARAGKPVRIAVFSSAQFVPHDHVNMLIGRFGGDNVVFDTELLRRIKYEKSPAELALVGADNAAADAAFLGMLAALEPGVRELDLAAVGDYIMKRLGAGRTGFPTIVSSGQRGRTVLGPELLQAGHRLRGIAVEQPAQHPRDLYAEQESLVLLIDPAH